MAGEGEKNGGGENENAEQKKRQRGKTGEEATTSTQPRGKTTRKYIGGRWKRKRA